MSCKIENIVKITTGSYKTFDITLVNEDDDTRIDLSLVTSSKIIIKTGTGAFVEKALTAPPADPKLGVINVELLGTETANLDKSTKSFELELINDGKTEIYLGENILDVTERLKTA